MGRFSWQEAFELIFYENSLDVLLEYLPPPSKCLCSLLTTQNKSDLRAVSLNKQKKEKWQKALNERIEVDPVFSLISPQ